jgi:hypothetical protein
MDPSPSSGEAFPNNAAPVPILVAETGHRDLVAAEVDGLRKRVRTFFEELARRWPDAPLMLMTSLAEGAGRLVAREALALRIPLIAVLPMPASLYREDFETNASKSEFDELCSQAEVYELPLLPGARLEDVAAAGNARDQQYAQLGVFLSSHCHVLLALWDGKRAKCRATSMSLPRSTSSPTRRTTSFSTSSARGIVPMERRAPICGRSKRAG